MSEIDWKWYGEQSERLLLGLYEKNLAFVTISMRLLHPDLCFVPREAFPPRAGFDACAGLVFLRPERFLASRIYDDYDKWAPGIDGGSIFDKEGPALNDALAWYCPQLSEAISRCSSWDSMDKVADMLADAGCQGSGQILRNLVDEGVLSETVVGEVVDKTVEITRIAALFQFVLAMRRHAVIYKALGMLYTNATPEKSVRAMVDFADERIRYWLWGKDWEDHEVGLFDHIKWVVINGVERENPSSEDDK